MPIVDVTTGHTIPADPILARRHTLEAEDDGPAGAILIEPLRFLAGQLVKAVLLIAIVRRATPRRRRGRRGRR